MGKIPDEPIAEIPLELKADVDIELVEEFISDAREQLLNIEQGTLALEKDAEDQEVLNTLFRAFHTFKGNAGFLDLTAISQFAHALESLLDGAREGRLQIDSVIIDIILKSRDTLQQFVDEIEAQITGRKPRAIVVIPTAALKAATQFILQREDASAVREIREPVEAEEASALDATPDSSAVTGQIPLPKRLRPERGKGFHLEARRPG